MSAKGFLANGSVVASATSADSGPIDAVKADLIGIDVNITAIVAGSIQFFYERQDAYGVYFPVWTSSVLSATGKTSITIGAGTETNRTIGTTGRLRWTIVTGPCTFTWSIIGQ